MNMLRHQALQLFNDSIWAMRPDFLESIGNYLSGVAIELPSFNRDQPTREAPYKIKNGVAVIPICGVLTKDMNFFTMLFGGTSTQDVAEKFKQAQDDPGVCQIVLDINSPGGTVAGTTELASLIYSYRGNKPCYAHTSTEMASAAYWIGSAADAMFAWDTAFVGSIGVYREHVDLTQAMANEGVKITYIAAGKMKTSGIHGSSLTEKDMAYHQGLVDDLYLKFVEDVSKHIGVSQESLVDNIGAKIYMAPKAADMGLINGVMSFDDMMSLVASGKMDSGMMSGMTHNSKCSDNEPTWSTYLDKNRSSLPDNAFADEAGRRFPHHWVDEDSETMYLHRGGLNSAWAAAHGARSGKEASSDVVNHLQEHRRALGLDSSSTPFTKEELMTLEELQEQVKAMQTQVSDLQAKMSEKDAQISELTEAKQTLDKALTIERMAAQAAKEKAAVDGVVSEVMASSTLPDALKSKAVAMVDFNKYRVESGDFDAAAYKVALTAEVESWQAAIPIASGSIGLTQNKEIESKSEFDKAKAEFDAILNRR